MKALMACGALALMTICGASALAQPAGSHTPVCLRGVDINNTTTPDSRTILFHMNDGAVWRNDLRTECPQLNFQGFAYVATPPDRICGNLQSIRVLRSGAVCLLGPFTKVKPGRGDRD